MSLQIEGFSMFRPVILAAVGAAFIHVPAAAQSGAEGPATDQEKVICKKVVKTGSVMPKRTCLTKAKWDAIEESSQEDLQRVRDQDRARSMTSTIK
jgi:hypothetical protein